MSKIQIAFGIIVGLIATLGLLGILHFPAYIQIPFVTLFMAIWLFTGGIHAKQMLEKGLMDGFLKWAYAPLVACVILLDVVFNVIWGTLIFREWPQEWLFTDRVKRHMLYRDNATAHRWAVRLNYVDPGHV